jgi:hypothetical protein
MVAVVTVLVAAVVVAGLRGLVERRGFQMVMPVRLVRAVLVGVVRTRWVLVVAVVTVGMAAAAVVGRLMVAVVVAADLATSHLMLYRVRLLERPVTATER